MAMPQHCRRHHPHASTTLCLTLNGTSGRSLLSPLILSKTAAWLENTDPLSADPRVPFFERGNDRDSELETDNSSWTEETTPKGAGKGTRKTPPRPHLVFKRQWYFTGADPDHYPSVPHGHHSSPNRKWPKLNPYTGRVFVEKHQERIKQRLSKLDMQLLWRDEKFRNFCRQHILWYLEAHPDYTLPVRRPLRLPRW